MEERTLIQQLVYNSRNNTYYRTYIYPNNVYNITKIFYKNIGNEYYYPVCLYTPTNIMNRSTLYSAFKDLIYNLNSRNTILYIKGKGYLFIDGCLFDKDTLKCYFYVTNYADYTLSDNKHNMTVFIDAELLQEKSEVTKFINKYILKDLGNYDIKICNLNKKSNNYNTDFTIFLESDPRKLAEFVVEELVTFIEDKVTIC